MSQSLSERFPGVIFTNESRVLVGDNVIIQPGTIIGATPLMTKIKDKQEEILSIKGNIIIEDDVKIGAGVTINFGCGPRTKIWTDPDGNPVYGRDTVIKKGAFVWHHANLGHDVIVGEHTKIGAYVCIAGACEIGEWSYFAIGSMTNPLKKIGSIVMVGSKSLVTKDIQNCVKVKGIPAKKFADNTWRPDGWTDEDERKIQCDR